MKKARACMLATYSEATDRSGDDIVLIKERIREQDGTERSEVRLIHNFQREFYITKKGHRATHKTKKEFEYLENLDVYSTNQARLPRAIAKAMGINGYARMSELRESPYLYGTDITTTSLIKQQYVEKWPTYQPEATVATLDTETNVFSERGEIIYGVCTFKDKAVLAVNGEWLGQMVDPEARIHDLFEDYLGKYKKERNIDLYVKVMENDLGVVKLMFRFLHSKKPDFVSIWNMAFDIDKIVECLEYYNVDPAEIFCDPIVPEKYRRFNWRKDNPQKTTATGKVTSKHHANLWHVVDAPASFYIIDAMCFFKINRVREAARHSYSLDNILKEELNLGKLRFKEAEGLEGLEWHQFMQKNHKLEYGVYAIFDGISLELLDEKTGDLRKAVLSGCGITDLSSLTSGPKNLANDLHLFLKEQGKIICATSPNMTEEMDSLTMSMVGWIVTLHSELLAEGGTPIISDIDNMPSKLFTHVFDVDIASGYPTTGAIMNISKATTLREVCGINGLPEQELRRVGVNMTAIRNNAIDLGQTLYNLPSMGDMLRDYKVSKG
jgi:hypothetical protein